MLVRFANYVFKLFESANYAVSAGFTKRFFSRFTETYDGISQADGIFVTF